MLQDLIADADSPLHGGAGYHLHVVFSSGEHLCLAVLEHCSEWVMFDLEARESSGSQTVTIKDGPLVKAAWVDWDAEYIVPPWIPQEIRRRE
jgi:hypothetical protein